MSAETEAPVAAGAARGPGPVGRLDALLAQPVDVRSQALLRILVGPIAVVHLAPIAGDALAGHTFHDRFYRPRADWIPILSPSWYTALLVAAVVAAAAMTVGAATRLATATVFATVAYELAVSTTHFHNNRAYLVTILLLLLLSPCGRAWSVDAAVRRALGRPRDATAPAWPLWLMRFECATVYAASGFSKLIDPDWFGGTVTWGRVVTQEHLLRTSVLPDAVVDVLVDRSFHTVAAKAIVLTELFIATGLWWRRTRPWAIATAIVFHVMIELTAAVQVFSYLAIAVLVVWAEPSLPLLRRATGGGVDAVGGRSAPGPATFPKVSPCQCAPPPDASRPPSG